MTNEDFMARNVGDNYVDPDWFAFHSFFTCMCIFVEEEHEGLEAFENFVSEARQAEIEFWKEHQDAIDTTLDDYLDSRVLPYEKTAKLYRWYQSCDWDGDTQLLNCSHELLSEKLKEAADIMWCWWT